MVVIDWQARTTVQVRSIFWVDYGNGIFESLRLVITPIRASSFDHTRWKEETIEER